MCNGSRRAAPACLIAAALFFISAPAARCQELVINEYLASNDTILADPAGSYDDWVELYNPGPAALDIGGMYMTDDLGEPAKWRIPEGTGETAVAAGGFLIVWFDGEPAQGPLHVDAKLSAGGEQIGLFRADLSAVDTLSFGPQTTDVSEGRVPDGGAQFAFFTTPTPGAPNGTGVSERVATPTATVEAGLKGGPFTVALDCETPGARITYTLDATEPDETSLSYTGPMWVDATTVLRARAFLEDRLDSYVATFTYLFDVSHSPAFAVAAVAVPPDDLFGPDGIYTRYTEDIEVGAHFELFEPDGRVALSQGVETEIHGTASAELAQKSLAIKGDASYGPEELRYPVFSDQPHDVYRSLILRNSGQDWNYTMFRDAAASGLVRNIDDVAGRITAPDVVAQGYRPAVVYLNGEYWGIHNIRDRFDHRYLLARYGLTRNQIDFLDEQNEIRDGDLVAWEQFQSFLAGANLADPAQFAQFAEWTDPAAFIDHNVFQVIIDNADWPGNNNRRFRERRPGARWVYMIKDLDFSTGLFVKGGPWNSGDWTQNSLERLLDDVWDWWPDPPWSTLAVRRAMANDGFRHDFINRLADMLNVLFTPQRWNARIDEFVAVYEPEMQQHLDRWNSGWNAWPSHVGVLRLFATNRAESVREHAIGFFPEIGGAAPVTLSVDGEGSLEFSTVRLDGDGDQFQGTWFSGIEIPARAVPCSGGSFERWSGVSSSTSPTIEVVLSSANSLRAHFTGGDCAVETPEIVLNEIHYHPPDDRPSEDWVELHNPGAGSVDLTGWRFADDAEGLDAFVLPSGTTIAPGGYLVLAEDAAALLAAFPGAENVIGDFGGDTGFGLSNGGELLVLFDGSGAVVDQVLYDDAAPWPTEPDGDGPSLSLLDPASDNGLAASWAALDPTPGRANGSDPGEDPQPQVIDFPELPQRTTDAPPFVIAATASSGLPVSFDIVSGPASVVGATVTLDGTVGTVVVRATQSGNTEWLPAPTVERAFAVVEGGGGGPMPTGYCASRGQQPWQSWALTVRFAGIDHTSHKEGYGDFTDLEAFAATSTVETIELAPAYSWEQFLNTWRVWIDWNRDGDFDDPGELVFETEATNQGVAGQIVVPAGASRGTTRMRVAMRRNEPASPCEIFTFGEVQDYAVVIDGGSGEPLPQTIQFGGLPDRPVDSGPFDITATASSGLPVSFSIISGPASVSGATITLAGSLGTVVVRASQAGNSTWLPAPDVDTTFEVVPADPGGPMPTGYCASLGEQPWQSWAEGVRFADIDHSSGKERYGDFTELVAEVVRGASVPLELRPAYSWERFLNTWRVWIDWNRDGDFADAGEMVLETAPTNLDINAAVSVPPDASPGTTRMRVTMRRNQTAAPCETFVYGEVQDYAVDVN